jgi:hypothetical protein
MAMFEFIYDEDWDDMEQRDAEIFRAAAELMD